MWLLMLEELMQLPFWASQGSVKHGMASGMSDRN